MKLLVKTGSPDVSDAKPQLPQAPASQTARTTTNPVVKKQLEQAFRFKPLGQERDSFAVLLDQDRFGFSSRRPH